jgi:hypothetical protein
MEDERCCGTGTCLINDEGLCWCGQQWNGEIMCRPCLPLAEEHPSGTPQDGATQEHAS